MKSRYLIILSYTFVLLFWACADSFKETEINWFLLEVFMDNWIHVD